MPGLEPRPPLTHRQLAAGAFYVDNGTIARQWQTVGIAFPCHCGELVELASDQVAGRICRCGCRYAVVEAEYTRSLIGVSASLTFRLEPEDGGPGILVRVTREA